MFELTGQFRSVQVAIWAHASTGLWQRMAENPGLKTWALNGGSKCGLQMWATNFWYSFVILQMIVVSNYQGFGNRNKLLWGKWGKNTILFRIRSETASRVKTDNSKLIQACLQNYISDKNWMKLIIEYSYRIYIFIYIELSQSKNIFFLNYNKI